MKNEKFLSSSLQTYTRDDKKCHAGSSRMKEVEKGRESSYFQPSSAPIFCRRRTGGGEKPNVGLGTYAVNEEGGIMHLERQKTCHGRILQGAGRRSRPEIKRRAGGGREVNQGR